MVAKISFRSAQLEALSLLMGANDYLADRGFEKLRKLLSELHPQFEQHTIADAYQAGQLLNLASPWQALRFSQSQDLFTFNPQTRHLLRIFKNSPRIQLS